MKHFQRTSTSSARSLESYRIVHCATSRWYAMARQWPNLEDCLGCPCLLEAWGTFITPWIKRPFPASWLCAKAGCWAMISALWHLLWCMRMWRSNPCYLFKIYLLLCKALAYADSKPYYDASNDGRYERYIKAIDLNNTNHMNACLSLLGSFLGRLPVTVCSLLSQDPLRWGEVVTNFDIQDLFFFFQFSTIISEALFSDI